MAEQAQNVRIAVHQQCLSQLKQKEVGLFAQQLLDEQESKCVRVPCFMSFLLYP